MGKEAAKWLRQVEPHFGFLSRLGFTTIDVGVLFFKDIAAAS